MSGVAMSGIMSGLDTEAIIEKLLEVESTKLKILENRLAEAKEKRTAIGEVDTLITTLQTSLKGLKGESNIRRLTVSSSDSAVASATATGSASETIHTLVVNQLAQVDKVVSTNGFAAGTSTIGVCDTSVATNWNSVAGTATTWVTMGTTGSVYSFQFGAEASIDITLDAGTSYSITDISDKINAAAGYSAATIKHDSKTDTDYMVIAANGTSTAATMSVSHTGESVDIFNDDNDWAKSQAGSAIFTYKYNDTIRSVSVSSTYTLSQLVRAINNDGSNPGVSASILANGTSSMLVLEGKNTGEDYSLSYFATSVPALDDGEFTVVQTAKDAEIQVDGYPSSGWLTRSSNSISDVITGVTVTLQGTGATTLSFTRDIKDIEEDLQTIVDEYNELQTKIAEYTDYDEENDTAGLLQGDSYVLTAFNQIRDALVGVAPGFSTTEDTYSMLAQIGITIDKYGTMYFDSEDFEDATQNDYDAVVRLIGAVKSGLSDSKALQFSSLLSSTDPGIYDVQATFDGGGNVSMARIKLSTEPDSAWRYMDVSGNTMTGKSGYPEAGLVILGVYSGSALETAQIRVRDGVADNAYNVISDTKSYTSGAISLGEQHYDTVIDNYEERIDKEEERLADREAQLKKTYARLESTLANLKGMQAEYQSALSNLSSSLLGSL